LGAKIGLYGAPIVARGAVVDVIDRVAVLYSSI
jgi:hypothetical protein